MAGAPIVLAVSAGVLAAANPCGFAMLPAYLSLMVAGHDDAGRHAAGPARGVGRALLSTAAVTTGFVAVFGLFGLVIAPVADAVGPRLPWLTVLLGLALVGVGGWVLAGRAVPMPARRGGRAPWLTGSSGSMVLFGAAYALSSLTCTIAPFLAIVVASAQSGSPGRALLLFGAYAAGMGLVVGLAALAVALVRTSVLGRMRRACAAASRAGGLLVVLAGAYVAYFGWYELRVLADPRAAGRDLIITAAATVQRELAAALDRAGIGLLLGVFAGLLAAATVAALVAGRPVATPRAHQGTAGVRP